MVLLALFHPHRERDRHRVTQPTMPTAFKSRSIATDVILIVASLTTLLGSGQEAEPTVTDGTLIYVPHGREPLNTTAAPPKAGPVEVRIAAMPAPSLLVHSMFSLALEVWFLHVVYRAYQHELKERIARPGRTEAATALI